MTAEPPTIRHAGTPEPPTTDFPDVQSDAAPHTDQPNADSPDEDSPDAASAASTARVADEPGCGVPRDQARAAKNTLGRDLADDPGFRGVGLSREDDGGYVLVVNVSTTEALTRVPGLVEGTPVRTRVTGQIHTFREQPGSA